MQPKFINLLNYVGYWLRNKRKKVAKKATHSIGFIRSFSLYRLLSLSINLNSSEYIDNYKSNLNDQL